MKFDRLRIAGFKTFVDPAELVIEPGLTGVVGPNGCGKSNLVEALRWVMGETSHKSMRASGMDDVIFSGSAQRPSRNHAEVTIRIDNRDHDAPTAFNDTEQIEVSRRIAREEGSTYRINGREVRARDVQLLFADAASGARSPSRVRQGQISELIAAKPQARRRILEDAAGIAGLHARRHDAELKLRAAEENLVRVGDVLKLIDGQIDSLRRQVRQAERDRAIAADIRQAEAVALSLSWAATEAESADVARQLDLDIRAVAGALARQGETERARGLAQHAIEPLRTAESEASAALQRLVIAREALDGELRRAEGRMSELDRRLEEIDRDETRARQLVDDAGAALARLAEERAGLAGAGDDMRGEADAADRLTVAETAMADADRALQQAQERLAEANVARQAAERARDEALRRVERLAAQISQTGAQLRETMTGLGALPDPAGLKAGVEQAGLKLADAETEAQAREQAARSARDAEAKLRPALQEADRQVQQLETEARTIRKMVDISAASRWPRAVDGISVAKGFEVALGAALGEDLDAATDPAAPAHWAVLPAADPDAPLPEGIDSLARHVQAPPALARRLRQIGIVARADGGRLSRQLRPGQRLVSVEGDLWRWDGFVAAANAPTPAARRLAEKNRLGDIEARAVEAARRRDGLRREVEAALIAVREASTREGAGRDAVREARRAFDSARDQVLLSERRRSEAEARLAGIRESLARLTRDKDEADSAAQAAATALAGIEAPSALTAEVSQLKLDAAERRAAAAEARAALQGFVREREMRNRRLAAIDEDAAAWRNRQASAEHQTGEVEARRAVLRTERAQLEGAPADLMARRRALSGEIEMAEVLRKAAADRRAEGETALALSDRAAREALAALSAAEVARARSEALRDAAADKRAALARSIAEEAGVAPEGLAALTGLGPGQPLPARTANEIRLADLKRERERIGAVNLRADEELKEVEASRQDLTREHDELSEAIRRLRRGIDSLNAEGRHRLNAAFEVVNGHFGRLFTRLFGGGSAELQLIESDDPLEAGLEIVANPPGKKPQVLTLLSGGEQALTATALIFAVFLTNPSPVCVLDEVDAPLDDANVERLCDLLADMARETETRFVVITHNPISMARMDRLYGVTMAERGVSQLVSVDLQAAERLAEAG